SVRKKLRQTGDSMREQITNIDIGFPKKLKRLRQERGWSQAQVASQVGIEEQRISKYERGLMYPTTKIMLKLVSIFEVSLDYLLRDSTDLGISKLKNQELLRRIEAVDQLPVKKQKVLIEILDAFIKQQKFEELVKE
ncbi:helix-turn-helix domain-containing protein, partial [bacterium]|nr:helix-turn-helix domain-containing protein [bacterium]